MNAVGIELDLPPLIFIIPRTDIWTDAQKSISPSMGHGSMTGDRYHFPYLFPGSKAARPATY